VTASHPGTPDGFVHLRARGWIISLCLHGAAVFLAGLFVAKLSLAPPSSSFHWEVTVVAPPALSPAASMSTTEPVVAKKPPRPAQRNVPVTSTYSSRTEPMNPTMPAPHSTAVHPEPLTATPVVPATTQTIPPVIEPSSSPPTPESQEPVRDQAAPTHASAVLPVPAAESLQSQTPSSSPEAEPRPSTESLVPPLSPPQATETISPPAQTAALPPSTSTSTVARKPDYGWLAATLLPRIEAMKQYPTDARLKHAEGRVVVRIIIQEDGQIVSATVAKSSGHDSLDQAALETVRKTSPITLVQPLEKPQITIQIPISYQLGR